jgi:hypothetical protein
MGLKAPTPGELLIDSTTGRRGSSSGRRFRRPRLVSPGPDESQNVANMQVRWGVTFWAVKLPGTVRETPGPKHLPPVIPGSHNPHNPASDGSVPGSVRSSVEALRRASIRTSPTVRGHLYRRGSNREHPPLLFQGEVTALDLLGPGSLDIVTSFWLPCRDVLRHHGRYSFAMNFYRVHGKPRQDGNR